MFLTSLLLLAMIVPGAPDRSRPTQPGAVPGFASAASAPWFGGRAAPPQFFQMSPWMALADTAPDDDICYRIRAYIFRRDDDHAPKMVRSTTCGPGHPRWENVQWPKARVAPAK